MKFFIEWWRYFASLAVIVIIVLFSVFVGLENYIWFYFVVFIGVIVGLIFEFVSGVVVAMVGIFIIVIFFFWLLFSSE